MEIYKEMVDNVDGIGASDSYKDNGNYGAHYGQFYSQQSHHSHAVNSSHYDTD